MIPRSQLVVAAIAAFLFGTTLGLISGIAGAGFMLGLSHGGMRDHEMHRILLRERGMPGVPPEPPIVFRLERELDLKPAQRDSISGILLRSRGRFAALRDSLRHEIETQLTPSQRDEWRRMERRMDSWRGPWPHRPEPDRP